MPAISVIIPHYNRQELIVPTLQSLKAQTCTDWELIVIDDASRENPTAVVRAVVPDARIILQPENRGPAAARNAGIDAAHGRFVAFLDSDDYWEPEKLERQLSAMLALPDPDSIFCVTLTRVIDAQGRERLRPSRAVRSDEHFAEFLYVSGEFAQSSSMMLSRQAAAQVRFRENLRQYEDHLFFIEAGNAGLTHLMITEPLTVWCNDDRADRLGRSDTLAKGQRYLQMAGAALGERACLAFQTRFLGPALLKRSPAKTTLTVYKALRKRAVSPRDVVLLLMKTVVPGGIYSKLKSRLR